MINLANSRTPAPDIHTAATDPGRAWLRDVEIVVDAPPDDDAHPLPKAQWPSTARRSGVCGAVSPRVIALPAGGFRLYYTQILPRAGFPRGANDYENSTARILSAISPDGIKFIPEPGVRLSPVMAGAGEFRVASGEVVPVGNGDRLRMYFECNPGSHSVTNAIRSAVSDDGLTWHVDPGDRLQTTGVNYGSPRILFLADGRIRLYCLERGRGIISAVSDDGGTTFQIEPGIRLAPGDAYDAVVAFAPEILQIRNAYVMYYAGYESPRRANILRATSTDGLHWTKEAMPVLAPGEHWDAAKCSEMCLFPLPQTGAKPRWRMLYEACDGTSPNARGVWRIAGATNIAESLRDSIPVTA